MLEIRRGGGRVGELKGMFAASVTLLAGSAAGRLIALVAIPLLTRIYSPADFGLLASFTAVLTSALPFATLRYAQAIPVVRTERAALGLVAIAAIILLGTTLLLAGGYIALLFGWVGYRAPVTTAGGALLVAAFALTGIYEILSNWTLRRRCYRDLSKVSVWQALATAGAKIGAGLVGLRSDGLILGQVAGQVAGLATLGRSLRNEHGRRLRATQRWRLARSLWQIPTMRLPSQFLLALSTQLPILFVATHYDLVTAGHFAIAMTLLNATISMAAQSFGQAFYGEVAAIFRMNRRRVASVTFNVQMRLLMLGAPIALGVYLLAPRIVPIVLGKEWALAGEILALLAPYIVVQFCATPAIKVLELVRSQWLFLLMNALRVGGVSAVIVYCANNGSDIQFFTSMYASLMVIFYVLVSCAASTLMSRYKG